jgi:ABC-type polysaccharide/polyol phosphate transport system ATPase subunit
MTMPRTRSAISATGLRKSFGDHLVLDGIDLDVAEGTIFALLGPNGAGKTTIVQILSTLIGADAGEQENIILIADLHHLGRGPRCHLPTLGSEAAHGHYDPASAASAGARRPGAGVSYLDLVE